MSNSRRQKTLDLWTQSNHNGIRCSDFIFLIVKALQIIISAMSITFLIIPISQEIFIPLNYIDKLSIRLFFYI